MKKECQVLTDLDLVLMARQGDNAAIRELADRHAGIYLSSVSRVVGYSGSVPGVEPEDLRFWIWQAAQDYNPSLSKFPTYLMNRVRYECLPKIRKRIRQEAQSEKLALLLDGQDNNQIDDETIRYIRIVANGCLDGLHARVFAMRHGVPPMKFHEIADKLGYTKQWACTVYHTALDKIRNEMRKDNEWQG